MTKREFLEQLQKMLARELDAGEVAENVRYYSEYIDNAVHKGKSEEQVLSELGDPRMIARTILDVGEKRAGAAASWQDTVYTESEDGAYHAEEDYDEDYDEDYGGSRGEDYGDGRRFSAFWRHDGMEHPEGFQMSLSGWKVWLVLIVLLVVLFAVLGTVFVIFWKLLPFLLVGWAAVSVYRWLSRR